MLALLGLPAAFRTVRFELTPLFSEDHLPFWAGMILVVFLWSWRWRHARWGRFITTIEHECLHALIGMLTLIPVRELKVREDGSGHVLFEPPGHWLLYLAPYFIPLLLLIEVGLIGLLKLPNPFEEAALGAVMALTLMGHIRQIHPRQTDFRHAGILFTTTFLPTAFLLCYSAVFSLMNQEGPSGVLAMGQVWADMAWTDAQWVWETGLHWLGL